MVGFCINHFFPVGPVPELNQLTNLNTGFALNSVVESVYQQIITIRLLTALSLYSSRTSRLCHSKSEMPNFTLCGLLQHKSSCSATLLNPSV